MMVLAGVEINNTNIRIWIHDKDLESLEKVLWEGEGYTLIKHTSGHAKVRKFLEAVPRLMVRNYLYQVFFRTSLALRSFITSSHKLQGHFCF